MSESVVELIVKTANPDVLDTTLQQLPGCVAGVVEGSFDGNACCVRVFSGLGFLRFAIQQQGYGEILAERQR